jgi:hypothetical protein
MSNGEPRTRLAGAAGSRTGRPGAIALLVGLALADFAGHMLVSNNYGYFRDELYYIEAGRHLSFGYVDFPPLVALVAKVLDVLAGDALWAIHVVPALASSLIVLMTGLMGLSGTTKRRRAPGAGSGTSTASPSAHAVGA